MHLVEPLAYLEGEYVLPIDGGLPAPRTAWQRALRKLNDPMNEAYTDAIFACMASRLVETGRSPHFCRFYGTYNGRVPAYWWNCTDDMGNIEDQEWFAKGLQSGALTVMAHDAYDPAICAPVTRPFQNIQHVLDSIAEEMSLSDLDTTSESDEVSVAADQPDKLEEVDLALESDDAVALRRNRVRITEGGSSTGDSSGSGSSYTSDSDGIIYKILLKNFPVQTTILERCDGTMDALMEDEIDDNAPADLAETKEQRWTAWIFQVIAALTVAQSAYDFVHNDLHTNNVMWTGTGETHLYYHVRGAAGGDRFYRVPTFGRIMKIIDFGRATFRAPAAGTQNRMWIPDAFAPNADAEGQYNCGNYFNQDRPKISPNKSFDLCRLAVALLDTLWPFPDSTPEIAKPERILTSEPGRKQPETVSALWNTLWLWLTDKHGRNILRLPDNSERYPGFDLYCAIAADSANAVPAQQLTLPLFDSAFRCRKKDIPADAKIWELQAAVGAAMPSKAPQKKRK